MGVFRGVYDWGVLERFAPFFFGMIMIIMIIIIIIKNEKIRVTLCENAAGALMCVDGQRNVWNKLMIVSIVTRAEDGKRNVFSSRRNVDKDVAARTDAETIEKQYSANLL